MLSKQKIDESLKSPIISDTIIEIVDLTKEYIMGDTIIHALDGINLKINKGEFVSIMGPSGSGKTTLLNMIGALDNPTSGEVIVNGINIAKMNDNQRTNLRLRNIGFIFQ
ncbi:MAG: ABC transporter ATP-binding protein, partial [Promethearchaeota archaeon]